MTERRTRSSSLSEIIVDAHLLKHSRELRALQIGQLLVKKFKRERSCSTSDIRHGFNNKSELLINRIHKFHKRVDSLNFLDLNRSEDSWSWSSFSSSDMASTFNEANFRKAINVFDGGDYDRFRSIVDTYVTDCNEDAEHREIMRRIITERLIGLPHRITTSCNNLASLLLKLEENFRSKITSAMIFESLDHVTMKTYKTVSEYSLAMESKIASYMESLRRESPALITPAFMEHSAKQLTAKFYRGLSAPIRAKLRLRNLNSVENAKQEALFEESMIMEDEKYDNTQNNHKSDLSEILSLLKEQSQQSQNQIYSVSKKDDNNYCNFHKTNTHTDEQCRRHIICNKCKKNGHYANTCRTNTSSSSNDIRYKNTKEKPDSVECEFCDKTGHEIEDCPKIKKLKILFGSNLNK